VRTTTSKHIIDMLTNNAASTVHADFPIRAIRLPQIVTQYGSPRWMVCCVACSFAGACRCF
jgi:hypothetical protein